MFEADRGCIECGMCPNQQALPGLACSYRDPATPARMNLLTIEHPIHVLDSELQV